MENSKRYVGAVLRAIREKRGFTCPEIASKHNVSATAIYDYEHGRSFPKAENANKLFSALKIDQKVFEKCVKESIDVSGVSRKSVTIGADGSVKNSSGSHGLEFSRDEVEDKANEIIKKSAESIRDSFRENVENSEVKVLSELPPGRSVPVISEAAAAECNPGLMPLIDCVNQNSEENSYFPNAREGDFAIRVSGNSMLPWYPTGTLLLVRPYQDIYNGKRVIAVLDDGEIVFKIFAKKSGKICLFSINGDGKDFVFPSSGKGLRFLCRVLQSIRNEDDLDEAMAKHGIHHNWEEKLKNI